MMHDPRLRFHRAEMRLVMLLTGVALLVATFVAAAVLPRADFGAAARLMADPVPPPGPVATLRWDATLRNAFDDLARLGVDTLPVRPHEAFAVRDLPDTGTIATTPPVPNGG